MENKKLQVALEKWQSHIQAMQEKDYIDRDETDWRVFITPSV